jgi:protease I
MDLDEGEIRFVTADDGRGGGLAAGEPIGTSLSAYSETRCRRTLSRYSNPGRENPCHYRTPERCVMAENLTGLRVAILATDGFEQSELLEPRRALHQAGALTEVISLKSGEIRGWNHKNWGETVAVDKTLLSAEAKNYDALLLPGGVMNPDNLRLDAKAVAFVKAFFDAGKPVGAICHGPWTIVEAGAAKGRTLTSWPSLKTDIQNAGGRWVDQEAVVDGNLVTSRNPKDIPAFNREIARVFAAAQSRAA